MAAQRFIVLASGKLREVAAVIASLGAADGEKVPALDTNGRLHPSVMPIGVTPEVTILEASESIAAGRLVNIYDDLGVAKARLADKTNGRKCDGYVLEGVSIGQQVPVYHEGSNTAVAALTPGARYYLDATGQITATPAEAPDIHQFIGKAVATDKLVFEPDDIVERA